MAQQITGEGLIDFVTLYDSVQSQLEIARQIREVVQRDFNISRDALAAVEGRIHMLEVISLSCQDDPEVSVVVRRRLQEAQAAESKGRA